MVDTVMVGGEGFSVAPSLQKQFVKEETQRRLRRRKSRRRTSSAPATSTVNISGSTVTIDGQSFSVAPSQQAEFIQQRTGGRGTSAQQAIEQARSRADASERERIRQATAERIQQAREQSLIGRVERERGQRFQEELGISEVIERGGIVEQQRPRAGITTEFFGAGPRGMGRIDLQRAPPEPLVLASRTGNLPLVGALAGPAQVVTIGAENFRQRADFESRRVLAATVGRLAQETRGVESFAEARRNIQVRADDLRERGLDRQLINVVEVGSQSALGVAESIYEAPFTRTAGAAIAGFVTGQTLTALAGTGTGGLFAAKTIGATGAGIFFGSRGIQLARAQDTGEAGQVIGRTLVDTAFFRLGTKGVIRDVQLTKSDIKQLQSAQAKQKFTVGELSKTKFGQLRGEISQIKRIGELKQITRAQVTVSPKTGKVVIDKPFSTKIFKAGTRVADIEGTAFADVVGAGKIRLGGEIKKLDARLSRNVVRVAGERSTTLSVSVARQKFRGKDLFADFVTFKGRRGVREVISDNKLIGFQKKILIKREGFGTIKLLKAPRITRIEPGTVTGVKGPSRVGTTTQLLQKTQLLKATEGVAPALVAEAGSFAITKATTSPFSAPKVSTVLTIPKKAVKTITIPITKNITKPVQRLGQQKVLLLKPLSAKGTKRGVRSVSDLGKAALRDSKRVTKVIKLPRQAVARRPQKLQKLKPVKPFIPVTPDLEFPLRTRKTPDFDLEFKGKAPTRRKKKKKRGVEGIIVSQTFFERIILGDVTGKLLAKRIKR